MCIVTECAAAAADDDARAGRNPAPVCVCVCLQLSAVVLWVGSVLPLQRPRVLCSPAGSVDFRLGRPCPVCAIVQLPVFVKKSCVCACFWGRSWSAAVYSWVVGVCVVSVQLFVGCVCKFWGDRSGCVYMSAVECGVRVPFQGVW